MSNTHAVGFHRLMAPVLVAVFGMCSSGQGAERPVAVATFRVDATPPLGTPLGSGFTGLAKKIIDPLSARGLVILADQPPIVLCAVDWSGIGNTGHDAWRRALAEAAGTTVDRVCVHVLHQHDAPGCDFLAADLLADHGLAGSIFDVEFAHNTIRRAAEAVRQAVKRPHAITHLGFGKAKVERVASNRRILGSDGKVQYIRWSHCEDPSIRAVPEGVIDPYVRLVSFWDGDHAIASLTYYAVHPQSFYGRGGVSTDFVGLARALREATIPEVEHIHFSGAAGNIAAGKYNDGEPARRYELAGRLAEGMRLAWESMKKVPVGNTDIEWRVKPVALPLRKHVVDETPLLQKLDDTKAEQTDRIRAALRLAWVRRCKSGHRIELASLRLGPVYILHLPGELFVEYQLAAQEMRPDDFVCMAANGDHGPCYIGTQIAYSQGGYETSERATNVAPEAESVLMPAIRELLR